MMRLFQIVSWVFTPLTMVLLSIGVVMLTPTHLDFNTFTNSIYHLAPGLKKFFFNSYALFGFILPVMSLLILKFFKDIDSVTLEKKEQRTRPIIFCGVFSFLLCVLLYKFYLQYPFSKHLFSVPLSCSFIAIVSLLINRFSKVSLHAEGAGIFIGFLLSYYLDQAILTPWVMYLAIFLSALIITSRLALNKHNLAQVFVGFSVGFAFTLATDIIVINIF